MFLRVMPVEFNMYRNKSVELKAAIPVMVAFFADCGKGMVDDGIKTGSDFQ